MPAVAAAVAVCFRNKAGLCLGASGGNGCLSCAPRLAASVRPPVVSSTEADGGGTGPSPPSPAATSIACCLNACHMPHLFNHPNNRARQRLEVRAEAMGSCPAIGPGHGAALVMGPGRPAAPPPETPTLVWPSFSIGGSGKEFKATGNNWLHGLTVAWPGSAISRATASSADSVSNAPHRPRMMRCQRFNEKGAPRQWRCRRCLTPRTCGDRPHMVPSPASAAEWSAASLPCAAAPSPLLGDGAFAACRRFWTAVLPAASTPQASCCPLWQPRWPLLKQQCQRQQLQQQDPSGWCSAGGSSRAWRTRQGGSGGRVLGAGSEQKAKARRW
jgi:hypothetical protein